MAPSSSGSGYLVLIQKIAGSNPAGVTTKMPEQESSGFFVVAFAESEPAKRVRWSEALAGVYSEKVERIKRSAMPQGSPY